LSHKKWHHFVFNYNWRFLVDFFVKWKMADPDPDVSLESSIRGLFGDVFGFNINVSVYEKLAKQERLFYQNSNASSKLLLPMLR